MSKVDLSKLTALEIGKLIKDKKISCVDVCEFFLTRIKDDMNKSEDDPTKINAFVSINEDYSLKRAKEIDNLVKNNENLSPLMGVPIGIKDNIVTTFMPTEACSKILTDYMSPFNATTVEKILDAGLVPIGKTNMDEFAMGGSTETSYKGICRNPYSIKKSDEDYLSGKIKPRVPGGSSGGSAAAVSGGLVPLALGSDTGGSIRQPCAFNNLVGLKPTYGSVSRYGLLAYGSSLDQIGPITKSVRDNAVLFSIISGFDKRDSTSLDHTVYRPCSLLHPEKHRILDITGVKIGVAKNYLELKGIDPEVKDATLKLSEFYKSKGVKVEEFELPLLDYLVPTYLIIACAEASSNLSRYDGVKYGFASENPKNINELYKSTRTSGFGTEVKRRILLGSFVLSSGYFDAYYKKALKVRTLIKEAFVNALKKYDVILMPLTPTVAYEIGENVKDPLTMYLGDIFTTGANLSGFPSISVPSAFNKDGMPIGTQLVSNVFDESILFNLSKLYEDDSNLISKHPF